MRNIAAVLIVSVFISVLAFASDFQVKVTDAKGNPVQNAVVALKPAVPLKDAPKTRVQIVQKDKEFIPKVSVMQAGGEVEFPNQDTVQHHVYSFSKPKRFDLPLYKDSTPKPVLFENPGIVTLGCNIHDWMKAYIYVADTPFFAKSGSDGILKISDLPPGSYQLDFWHPLLKKVSGKPLPAKVEIDGKSDFSDTVSVELKREVVPQHGSIDNSGGY